MSISQTPPPTKAHQTNPSPFGEVTPALSGEQIASNIALEIKRMQRRRQLAGGSPPPPGSSSPPHDPTSSMMSQTCSAMAAQSSPAFFNALSPSKRDSPLFTFRQVSLVCERMMQEREDQIRAQYDQVLTSKLAEQYEAFLKFNYDQIQRRVAESPSSYIS